MGGVRVVLRPQSPQRIARSDVSVEEEMVRGKSQKTWVKYTRTTRDLVAGAFTHNRHPLLVLSLSPSRLFLCPVGKNRCGRAMPKGHPRPVFSQNRLDSHHGRVAFGGPDDREPAHFVSDAKSIQPNGDGTIPLCITTCWKSL